MSNFYTEWYHSFEKSRTKKVENDSEIVRAVINGYDLVQLIETFKISKCAANRYLKEYGAPSKGRGGKIKIKDDAIEELAAMVNQNFDINVIAKKFKINRSTVYRLYKNWRCKNASR